MRATVQISKREHSGKIRTYKYTFAPGIGKTGDVSDGYHTFDELYRYRMLYNAAFFNGLKLASGSPESGQPYWFKVHKSRKHSDGKFCFDADGEWFMVMATLPTGQISNHYHADYWDLFDIPEQEMADEWDGHTPDMVAQRLEDYLKRNY